MPKTCTKCGATINDGEKFCTSCGTPVEVVRVSANRFCRQCGNMLTPGAKFCDVCGKEAPQEKKKEEPKVVEPATMEGIVSPVITEDTFAAAKELNREKFDGFEAAEMPGSAPAAPQTPPPAPSFEMDSAAAGQQPRPAPQPAPQPRPQVTPQSVQQSNPYGQYAATQNTASPMQQYGAPQQSAPMQPQMPQQQIPMPQSVPQPDQQGGKKSAAPVVLAVIIVLIIIVDVLVFFGPLGDKLKNKDKDDEKDCTQITLITDDVQETDGF